MRRYLVIGMIVFMALSSFGQSSKVDLKEVKNIAKTKSYTDLLDRFKANDTTLSQDDYVVLYYGHAYTDDYSPNGSHDSVRVLNMYLRGNVDSVNFQKVLYYTDMILNDYPFDIERIFITAIAYKRTGLTDTSDIWFYKYDKLIRAIMASGDGLSEETAFIVTCVADEYSILNAFGFQFTGQALTSKKKKFYDLMSIAENDFGVKELFFNIDLFYGKWQ
jgi:hypothetical protein